MKKLFVILVFSFLLIPQASQAVDQRCWVKEDCKTFRTNYGATDALGGFYDAATHDDARKACETNGDGVDVFGREIGFCLPVGETVTAITFGGQNKFTNIGEFIKFIYKYGFIVGAVVAVMVIIVAGIMYIFSGGNSDTVGQAKKKIFGALIGLALMALSYTILNNLNPYLTNWRLPGIWAINAEGTTPYACNKLPATSQIAIAKKSEEAKATTAMSEAQWFIPNNNSAPSRPTVNPIVAGLSLLQEQNNLKNKSVCGFDYFIKGEKEDQFCRGDYCTPGNLCIQGVNETNRSCIQAKIAGKIYATGFFSKAVGDSNFFVKAGFGLATDFWAWKWITNISIIALCQNEGRFKDSSALEDSTPEDKINKKTMEENYLMNYTSADVDNLASDCKNSAVVGFVFKVDVNNSNDPTDETHMLGLDENGNMVDLCPYNDVGINTTEESNDNPCWAYIYSAKPGMWSFPYFITAELLKKGFIMDIDVSKITYVNINCFSATCPSNTKLNILNNIYGKKWGFIYQ